MGGPSETETEERRVLKPQLDEPEAFISSSSISVLGRPWPQLLYCGCDGPERSGEPSPSICSPSPLEPFR